MTEDEAAEIIQKGEYSIVLNLQYLFYTLC